MLHLLVSQDGIFAAAGLVIFLVIVALMATHPRVGIVLALASQIPAYLSPTQQTPTFSLVGFHVAIPDVVSFAAIVVAITKLGGNLDERRRPITLWVVGILLVISLALGAQTFGPNQALNEARPFLGFFAMVAYGIAIRDRIELDWFLRVWVVWALLLFVDTLYGWSRYGIHTGSRIVDNQLVDARVIPAAAALAIAEGAVILVLRPGLIRFQKTVALALIVTVLLLQHRTLWVVTVVSIAIGLFTGRQQRRGAFGVVVAAAVCAPLALLVVSSGSSASLNSELSASGSSAFSQTGTFAWRLSSWHGLFEVPRGTLQWLIGQPLGTGYTREVFGAVVTVEPHNFYVQMALRVGIVGTLALVALLVRGFRSGIHSPEPVLGVLMIAITLFFVTYAPPLDQGLILGLAVVGRSKRGAESQSMAESEGVEPSRAFHPTSA